MNTENLKECGGDTRRIRIYTSYFAKSKKLAENGLAVIGVALYPPRWYRGPSLYDVAPTPSILFAKGQTQETYVRRYKEEVLARRDAHQLLEKIRGISQGRDVALCCFEKPEDFCHRHILAEWLGERLGLDVREYQFSDGVKKGQPQELLSFVLT